MKFVWILFITIHWAIIINGLDQEDNDFADFEFYDDEAATVEVNKAPGAKGGAKDTKTNEDFIELDDSDDGIVEDDEFDHFSDKDEFEGFAGSDDALPLDKKTKEPKLTIAKVPLHFRKWDSYWIEMLFLLGLMVYFVNYAMGKSKNVKIANAWLNAHKSFLEENFALVGDDGKKETDYSETGIMLKESDSVFTLWCSGRVCCEGMLVELKLIKRQDLLSLTIGLLSAKNQDQVVVKAEISKDSMDSFVFAVSTKKCATKLFKDMSDLKQYCVSVAKADEKYNLPTGYSVLSELAEASSAILDARLVAMLHKYNNVIESIHISDQYVGVQVEQEGPVMKQPETKKMLIVSFFISEKTDMEEFRPLLQLVIYLIDKLKRFKLSREGKMKAEKNRMRVEEEFLKSSHALRMEAAAQKKEEKRKQEKEKIMNEDNVEKQIKLERKMKRKDAKKAMPKMKSMSIHL
ncbi:CLUMA_CG013241, isoform A [Clunio marinus]|uniref:PAT complex subunit CCDC47 n=1 Tax=Clunio marinus TaxID=568069 RepID=A0A1J1ILJ2_9DIPT|nr:CLUMA_CG013241, isoform A [Clunio marinus]